MNHNHSLASFILVLLSCTMILLVAERGHGEESAARKSSLLGATRSEVIERLGEPDGILKYGGTEILDFFRGTVELENGRVIRADVISREEAAQEEKERLERERRMREAAEAHSRKMIEEGTLEKARILADEAYSNMTPEEVIAYWDEFSALYPEVSIDQQTYQAAKKEVREQVEAERQATLAAQEEELPPKPDVSSKKKRKMMRAGKWIWD